VTPCQCDGIRHVLNGEERRRARRALERAQTEGNREAAAHQQARLDQCPTAQISTTEEPSA
jgi:RNA polymerase-interacting CarD/CdnL/TRCF family regulator